MGICLNHAVIHKGVNSYPKYCNFTCLLVFNSTWYLKELGLEDQHSVPSPVEEAFPLSLQRMPVIKNKQSRNLGSIVGGLTGIERQPRHRQMSKEKILPVIV